ncbi:MAG: pilus assembly protein [Alphaproteobacteria bacterium]|nr:pilus assembly protein [Alphaproteobacteria bacterium]
MRRLAQIAGSLARARDGATAVEFALIAPVLFLLLLGLIEVGRAYWIQSALDFAVQETARCGVVQAASPACATPAALQTYAAARVAPLQIPATAFTVANATCGVDVKAVVPYRFLAILGPTITAEACRA